MTRYGPRGAGSPRRPTRTGPTAGTPPNSPLPPPLTPPSAPGSAEPRHWRTWPGPREYAPEWRNRAVGARPGPGGGKPPDPGRAAGDRPPMGRDGDGGRPP